MAVDRRYLAWTIIFLSMAIFAHVFTDYNVSSWHKVGTTVMVETYAPGFFGGPLRTETVTYVLWTNDQYPQYTIGQPVSNCVWDECAPPTHRVGILGYFASYMAFAAAIYTGTKAFLGGGRNE